MKHKENEWNVYAKSLHMCQWWVLLGLEVLCSDVSGVDTAILFYSTLQPCMISSLSSAPLKLSFVDVQIIYKMSLMITLT